MPETLSGVIERVTFHNAETGFAVLRVQAQGRRDLVTVVGQLPSAVAGEYVEATGAWKQDREHGLQFQAEQLRSTPPHTAQGIEKYLASGFVKGIGPHYARKIVDVFGERTLQVIDESPTFLSEIKGIGPHRLERIRQSWQQQKAVRAIMVFLNSHGIGPARATRIYKTYGAQAIEIVRGNPYRLASDIWGVGFRSADGLAQRMNIERNSPLRAQAALRYVLQELSHEGHCGFPESGVIERTKSLTKIAPEILQEAVGRLRQDGEVVRESMAGAPEPESWLMLRPLFDAEVGIAHCLRRLQSGARPLPNFDTEAALQWIEQNMRIKLATAQRDAIRQAVEHKVLVITGGPGVGKTTIVRGILEIFAAKGLRCLLAAPTGRAAKRLSETTRRPAKTIHRLLEFEPRGGGFLRNEKQPLDADLVIIDETSMVDVVLMHHLLRAVPTNACLVLVGDVDQLPSVGPGAVLADIIVSGAVPVVRLTEIFRQASRSWIVQAAHQVKHGELPTSAPDRNGDFYFIETDAPDAIEEKIITLVRDRIPARFGLDPIRDVQVLTPMNRTQLGSRSLNARLQEMFNPASSNPDLQRHGWTFRMGDKVLQTVNNYDKEVFNGDIGRVKDIDPQERELTVEFDGRGVVYDLGELDELALAYALTIHKSQGSEYPAVVIPLHNQHFVMLQRNLLYTGITRGKQLVVLVGNRIALATAVERKESRQRNTLLRRRLQAPKPTP